MKKINFLLLAAAVCVASTSAADDFVIATGGEGGGYERQGKILATHIDKQLNKAKQRMDIEVINSTGSVENLELLNSGEAQMAIVQADAMNVMPPSISFKAKASQIETVFWVYNVKNDFDDLEDVEGTDALIVLVDGSGAMVTMQSFAKEDSGYKKTLDNAILADDLYDAFDIVSEGKQNGKKVAGLLYVSTRIPSEVATDFKGKVLIGEATDSDFNDAEDVNGDSLYTNCDVNKAMAGGLTDSWGSIETVCVQSMVVYNTDMENRKIAKAVKKGVNKALRGVK
jgi:TRAP-type uncharacterized transport system substrate-binding protein